VAMTVHPSPIEQSPSVGPGREKHSSAKALIPIARESGLSRLAAVRRRRSVGTTICQSVEEERDVHTGTRNHTRAAHA
jgi:hypothetical protein